MYVRHFHKKCFETVPVHHQPGLATSLPTRSPLRTQVPIEKGEMEIGQLTQVSIIDTMSVLPYGGHYLPGVRANLAVGGNRDT